MTQVSQSTATPNADAARAPARILASHVRCPRAPKRARGAAPPPETPGAAAETLAREPTASVLAASLIALLAPVILMFVLERRSELHLALRGVAALIVIAAASATVALARRRSASRAAPQKLGAYTLDARIGEGGMGVVYRATHAHLPRPVAIKILPRERASARNRALFEREAQRTSLLSHPNTISVFDSGSTPDGGFYYAMELVEGLDLQATVERDGPLAPERAALVLAQVLGALREAHAAGLVHRDVKPANIMLCARGGASDVVKLLDFGLVQELDSAEEHSPCDPNELVGTPLYIAPEALLGEEPIDARSDLYAVGAVGYFLLTGVPPFSGRNVLEVCARHLHETPVPPSQRLGRRIPEDLEALIVSCLAKCPEARPSSAAALESAFLRLAAPSSGSLARSNRS
jgi:serine/threonine-protein kinase